MKKLIPLVLLLLAILCGCASNSYPTAPTTQPTEAPDPLEERFAELGRVCGVVADGDGYVFMTHTGFYRFDSELQRADSGDLKALNALFDAEEVTNPFARMKNSPNYEKSLLTALTNTSKGLMFFCYGDGTFYLNGAPWATVRTDKISADDTVQILEHDGSIYALVMGEELQTLIRDGDVTYKMPTKNSAFELGGKRKYTGMFVLDGQLYVGVGSYAPDSLIPSENPQMGFLVPVPADSEQLSYDGCRTGYDGTPGACCVCSGGTYLYFPTRSVGNSLYATYIPEELLFVTDETTVTLSLAALGEDGQQPVAIVVRPDGGLLFLTHRGTVILSDVVPVAQTENVVLTLGTISDTPDYGIHTMPMYYAALANSADIPGKNLSVCLRTFDSDDALLAAMEAGEIEIFGTNGLEPMQLLAERGMFKDLCKTNKELFEEDGLCSAVVNTFAKNGSAYFIPTQLSVQATLLYADKGTSLWTQDGQPKAYSLDEVAALFEAVSVKDNYTALDLYSSAAQFSKLVDAFIGGNVDFATGTFDGDHFAALLKFCDYFKSKELLEYFATHPNEAYDLLNRQQVKLESDITLDSLETAVNYLRNNAALFPMEEVGANGTQLYAGYYMAVCNTEKADLAAEALSSMLGSEPISRLETAGDVNLPVLQNSYSSVTFYRHYTIEGVDYSAQARAMLDAAFYGCNTVTIRNESYEAVHDTLCDVARAYFNGTMTAEQATEKARSMVENLLSAS